jgi:hypothetical protein
MTSDLQRINKTTSTDEAIEHDIAWAVMVDLDPDEFTAQERSIAQEMLASSGDVESWDELRSNLSKIKDTQEQIIHTRVESGILTEHQRAQLQKLVENIARENALSLDARESPPSWWMGSLLTLRSPVFAWSAVLGLSIIGLWSYQTSLKDSPRDLNPPLMFRGSLTTGSRGLLEDDQPLKGESGQPEKSPRGEVSTALAAQETTSSFMGVVSETQQAAQEPAVAEVLDKKSELESGKARPKQTRKKKARTQRSRPSKKRTRRKKSASKQPSPQREQTRSGQSRVAY